MKQWEFVPFYISLNHHFWNGLAGHAKSLMKLIGTIVSQEEGINEGLKGMGEEVINLLLKKTNGPRILIDIKHMSPKCRKDFYGFIKREYWNKNDKFPLICSHTGVVSKSRTLDALIQQDDDNELHDDSNYLHENSINLCAEDVLIIAETKGLIGLQLDEKRIAVDNLRHNYQQVQRSQFDSEKKVAVADTSIQNLQRTITQIEEEREQRDEQRHRLDQERILHEKELEIKKVDLEQLQQHHQRQAQREVADIGTERRVQHRQRPQPEQTERGIEDALVAEDNLPWIGALHVHGENRTDPPPTQRRCSAIISGCSLDLWRFT